MLFQLEKEKQNLILLLAFCRIQQTQDCHLQLVLYSLLLFLYKMT